jgi:acyl-CoA synthetase (AMP-forming)/AMP-acid ligase II
MNVTFALHGHARREPAKPALITGRETLTYRALDALLWRAAAFLRGAGLTAGDCAVLAVAHPLLHLLSGLALARLGVAFASLAPGDSAMVLKELVSRVGARAVVTQSLVPGFEREAQIIIGRSALAAGPDRGRDLMCEDSGWLWHFVTGSGTTGKPKLFALSHERAIRYLHAFGLGVPTRASDVFLSFPGPYFFGGVIHNLHALSGGATVLLPFAPAWETVLALMQRTGVNRIYAVPSTLLTLLGLPGHEPVVARLSAVATGGAVVAQSLRERILNLTPGLVVLYGSNETGFLTSTHSVAGLGVRDGVGRPLPYGAFEIVDHAGQPVRLGEVGEIRAKRDSMAESYIGDAAATERIFRDGWFHPGDLGCWAEEQQVVFKGRADDMMIFDGINIFPTEIESCLGEHPGVQEAIAFPLRSDHHGSIPAAAVRLRAEVAEAELIGFCRERLGLRHPRHMMIVDDFPRSAAGKPLKREMAKLMMRAAG